MTWADRRFTVVLLVLCAAALVARLVMLREYWRNNPIAQHPILDGAVYWDLAGRYAQGHLIGDTPFVTAPLYPYMLGLVRVLGGGLLTVYLLQMLAHLLTAVLLARIGRARFGASVGLLSAGLFLVMTEPATACYRVLSSTLQLLLVVWLWAWLIRAQGGVSAGRWAVAGVLAGLLCLANGSMLVLSMPLVAWALFDIREWKPAIGCAAAMAGAWVLVLAPATAHNLAACGEFIPLAAHAGLTLRHGNGPGSIGTYNSAPGVSDDKERQHADAFAAFERQTGQPATWRAVDRFFRGQVFAYWSENPLRAIALAGRKAYWFLTSVHYSDIHHPTLETNTGLDRWWRLAPLPTAWLIPLSLVGLIVLVPQWRRYGPELIIFIAVLCVVIVFWYTPRYRVPAVPVIVLLACHVLHRAWSAPRKRSFLLGVGGVLGVTIGLQAANRVTGFDSPDGVRAAFHGNLANVLARTGRRSDALDHDRRVLQYTPDDEDANCAVASALHDAGDLDGALAHYQRAADHHPQAVLPRSGLGTVYAGLGQHELAVRWFKEALQLDPDCEDAHYNLAGVLLLQGDLDQAVEHYRQVLRIDPGAADAWYQLARTLQRLGDPAEAARAWHEGLGANPDNVPLLIGLAQWLTTCPDPAFRDASRALEYARRACGISGSSDPHALEAQADALAELGRLQDAVQAAREALERARAGGLDGLAVRIEAKLAAYEKALDREPSG